MSYIIGSDCIDIIDRACVDVCPVDCIYEGDRKSYINPNECIDCGACEVECPVAAISVDRMARNDPDKLVHLEDSKLFFETVLAGRSAPLGNPGGAGRLGEIGVDTILVASHAG